jgi:transposase
MWGERNRNGEIVCAETVRRRIKETALRNRKMLRRWRLSPAHVAAREQWAMQRVHWRQNQWQRVLFTDECRFCLFQSDGRMRVWREPGQQNLPQNVRISENQGPSVHVWAGITLHGKTELVFLERNVNANSYGELLETHAIPFMQQVFGGLNNCILQDDNAPAHRAAAVQLLKQQLGVRSLRWPSRSPDMNPIEHVWSFLKRAIQRENPPDSLRQLREALHNAWQQLPQRLLQQLILGMPRRITALIQARGGYTRY